MASRAQVIIIGIWLNGCLIPYYGAMTTANERKESSENV